MTENFMKSNDKKSRKGPTSKPSFFKYMNKRDKEF